MRAPIDQNGDGLTPTASIRLPPLRDAFCSRIFSVVAGKRHRLEDFLTELTGHLLQALAESDPKNFTRFCTEFFFPNVSDQSARARWQVTANECKSLSVHTQFPIEVSGARHSKRPDIVIMADRTPLAIIECKVGAGFTSDVNETAQGEFVWMHQLEMYGRWLEEHGITESALILLTQYSDPPEGFYDDARYAATLRAVRRWSELRRYLSAKTEKTSWLKNAFQDRGWLVDDFVQFLGEEDLVTDDVQPNDLAAARIYLTTDSHQRLLACVNEASKRVGEHLQAVGFTKRSMSGAIVEAYGENYYLYDRRENTQSEALISWGFWFGKGGGGWRVDYDPYPNMIEGAYVGIEIPSALFVRSKNQKYPGWFFPKNNPDEPYIFACAPFEKFLEGDDTTRDFGTWMEKAVLEAVGIFNSFKK